MDKIQTRAEKGKKILRALPIWSEQYGLIGKADVVEVETGPGPSKRYRPVEYKSGKKREDQHSLFQATAQALCLEEMFDTTIREAVVYYFATKDRVTHEISEQIRQETKNLIEETRRLLNQSQVPLPPADKRCRRCSLMDACQPHAVVNAIQAKQNPFQIRAEADLP